MPQQHSKYNFFIIAACIVLNIFIFKFFANRLETYIVMADAERVAQQASILE